MSSIHTEVLLASGYALFLVVVATCLETLGRHTNQRSRQYQTAGFTYHHHHNVWECPAGQYLKLWAFDSHRRIAQYRAEAKVCNSCALKRELYRFRGWSETGAPSRFLVAIGSSPFSSWNFAGAAFPGGTDSFGRNDTPDRHYRFGRASQCHGAGRHAATRLRFGNGGFLRG